MNKNNKKYCKNCKYNSPFGLNDLCYYTRKQINEYTKTIIYKNWCVPKNVRNICGNCEVYKRKWWKFWVK